MAFRGGSGRGDGPRVKKVMTQAINLIFEFLKNVGFFCFTALFFFYEKNCFPVEREGATMVI